MNATENLVAVLSFLLLTSCTAPNSTPNIGTNTNLAPETHNLGANSANEESVIITYQPPRPRLHGSSELAGTSGVIKINFYVGPDGAPISVKLIDCPPSLAQIMIDFGMKWRFKIPDIDGKPQYARFTLSIPYNFSK